MSKLSYFPELREPKLFLASPGDVQYLRRIAQQVVGDLDGTGGGADSLAMFAWEVDLADMPFNDSAPIQEQIYRPDDPMCRGVVAFFGEKIGQPLAADFPTDMLHDLVGTTSSFALVHPWLSGAADAGGFPLTGSTFEVLCAIAANRRRRAEGISNELPVFLRFVGPADCVEIEDPGRANWGNRELRNRLKETFADDDEEEFRHRRMIREQLKCLRNFVLFLKALGIEPRFETDVERIEIELRRWLGSNFLLNPNPTKVNPFLGLRTYDVKDYHIYFGRSEVQKKAIDVVEAIFRDETRPNFYWIEGSSGSGKSSFLRAGVIGGLQHSPRYTEKYAQTVNRPNDLLSKAAASVNSTHCPLRALLQKSLDAFVHLSPEPILTQAEADSALTEYDVRQADERSRWAATMLESFLERANAGRDAALLRRLIIGLDQFEEIIDMLEDDQLAPRWQLFVEFIAAATKCRHIFVLATIRAERIEKMKRNERLRDLDASSHQQRMRLTLPSDPELETIIRRPFHDYGRARLDEALVARLVKIIQSYTRLHTVEEVGSVLPLVSLTLLRIHENVAKPLIEKQFESQDQRLSLDAFDQAASDSPTNPATTGLLTITLDDAKDFIEMEGVIAELAEKAMEAAREQQALEAGENTVDSLLRQLVRWSGADDKQFSLPTVALPNDSSERALALALVKHRLVVDEGDEHIRLVHETVLQHWPEARDFIQRERPLHENARELMTLAKLWSRSDSARALLDAGLEEHAEAAFQILSLWSARFHPYFCKVLDPKDEALRNYCLALLDAACEPLRVVDASPKKPTHLHLATFYGCHNTIKKMLDGGGEETAKIVNVTNSDGRTPLISPCFMDDVELIELLLKFGADPNTRETLGWQALHAAAVGGSIAITRCLLNRGAEVDLEASPERTHPIHLAAQNGHKNLVSFYVDERGVDIDHADLNGHTPIMRAINNDQAEMIRHLVDKGADLTVMLDRSERSIGINSLHYAARAGAIRSLETLLDLGMSADISMRNGWSALHIAAHNNFPASVRVLAGHMANVNAKTINAWDMTANEKVKKAVESGKTHEDAGWTALHLAAGNGLVKVIQALYEKGANCSVVTSQAETPLHVAVRKDQDAAAILLSGLAPHTSDMRNEQGRTPLQLAVFRKRLALAADLMRQGATISQPIHDFGLRDEDGATLLHSAARSMEEANIRFVLNYEKGLGRKTARRRNALHVAAGAGRERILSRLLAQWSDGLLEKDEDGYTPFDAACLAGAVDCAEFIAAKTNDATLRDRCPNALHYAAQSGRARLVQKLIDRGFDPQAYDKSGRTPLHIAAQDGHTNAVKELLLHEVKPLRPLRDDPDVTAFDIATESGQTDVLEVLLARKEAAAIDAVALVFRAIDLMRFDCVALLLRYLEVDDLPHPTTGILASTLYHAMLADIGERVPGTALRSITLETVIPQPAVPQSVKKRAASDLSSTPDVEAGAKTDESDALSTGEERNVALGDVMTQSRLYGLGGDVYPEYERRPRNLWKEVFRDELTSLVDQITPVDGKYPLSLETVRVFRRSLPWYDGVEFLNLADTNLENPKLRLCYLAHQGNLYRLNGTSPPIHELNAKAPIKLNEQNVADYLRFFTFFVHGEEGPFYVCEDENDPLIPGSGNPQVQTIVKSTARPISYEGKNEKGHYLLDAVLYYSNAIFIANFAVQPSGMIEMLDDEPIAADLPFKIDAPLA